MQTHAKGPAAGWWWLIRGCAVLGRDTGKILGAAALLGLCMLLITAAQMLTPAQGHAKLVVMGVTMIVAGVLYPVLYGGFMRVIDASRNGRPVSALMLFEPFKPGQNGTQLALFGLCMLAVYVAFLALVVLTVGHDMGTWYMQVLAHQAPFGSPPHPLPKLPANFALTLALLTVFLLFYFGATAIGVGQASLRGEAGLAAFRDGIAGAFKNVLPLVVLAICGILALLVVSVVLGFVGVLVIGLVFLASKVAGIVIAIIFYIAFILFMFAIMMGINYAIWHDVAGATPEADTPPPLPDVQG
jgi:hypothetical protein